MPEAACWFHEGNKEIQELLEKKRLCHNRLLAKPSDQTANAAYTTVCSKLQDKLRTMYNNLWKALVDRAQRYAGMGDMHAFYDAPKAVYGPSRQIQAPSTLLRQKYPADSKEAFSDKCTLL